MPNMSKVITESIVASETTMGARILESATASLVARFNAPIVALEKSAEAARVASEIAASETSTVEPTSETSTVEPTSETVAKVSADDRRALAKAAFDAAVATLPAGLDAVDCVSLANVLANVPKPTEFLDVIKNGAITSHVLAAAGSGAVPDMALVGAVNVLAGSLAARLAALTPSTSTGPKPIDPVAVRRAAVEKLASLTAAWHAIATLLTETETAATSLAIESLTTDEATIIEAATISEPLAKVLARASVIAGGTYNQPRAEGAPRVRRLSGESGTVAESDVPVGARFTFAPAGVVFHAEKLASDPCAYRVTDADGKVIGESFSTRTSAAKVVNGGTSVNGPKVWIAVDATLATTLDADEDSDADDDSEDNED